MVEFTDEFLEKNKIRTVVCTKVPIARLSTVGVAGPEQRMFIPRFTVMVTCMEWDGKNADEDTKIMCSVLDGFVFRNVVVALSEVVVVWKA